MKRYAKKGLSLLLALVLTMSLATGALAVSGSTLDDAVTDTAAYLYKTVKSPQVGSIGGEWAVLGLARSGYAVPEQYYQDYYATVEAYVTACKGVMHEKKYTEYSRVTVALTAIGKNPANVAGYNLLTPLGDYDKTIWQGINGPIWALIALDSGNYAMPQNPTAATQATRQMYVSRILALQLSDGGFSLTGEGSADPDITGMALQALAKYQSSAAVKTATDRALSCLSNMQESSGGFSSWGTSNSESVVQVIVALCELGISLDDTRFVKNGNTLLHNLLSYRQKDGSFMHTSSGSGSNQMATEQGFYGIVAALRASKGENTLYRMSDALSIGEGTGAGLVKGAGLANKNADVAAVAITSPGASFTDIIFSDHIAAIQALASRGIIAGKGNGLFDPDASMTRAEFATIVVRALGLTPKANDQFSDVKSTDWFAPFVGTAYTYGLVNGTSSTTFNPYGTMTRQEAATMVASAAALCGMDTELDRQTVRDMLAQFGDYTKSADWARSSLAFCYSEGILDQSDLNINPKTAILRCEIAEMLFRMLGCANLI